MIQSVSPAVGLLAAAFFGAALPGQSLISNLETITSGNGGSAPSEIAVVGNTGFFACTGRYGSELFVTDGTQAGSRMLLDLMSPVLGNQTGGSRPRWLTPFNGELLFSAIVNGHGEELWKTDGTVAGTRLVADVNAFGQWGSPSYLTQMGNEVFFAAVGTGISTELFATDGTLAGTRLVKDIESGGAGSSPTGLVAVGSTLFFAASQFPLGTQLWKSDGTNAGTVKVAQIGANSAPEDLTAFGGGVLFSADDGANGREPYFSDGTAAGTVRLGDLFPGGTGSFASQFTVVGSRAVFAAVTSAAGTELFTTDGTAAGTSMIDVNPGVLSSFPRSFFAWRGNVYFQADDGVHGAELWRTDGTAGGTVRVADIYPGIGGSRPTDFAAVGNELWFAATDALGDREPWSTDGTAAGTRRLLNINNIGSSAPTLLVPFRNGVLCSVSEDDTGEEPGFIDGTVSNSGVLIEAYPTVGHSSPDAFGPFPGGAFFSASNGVVGDEAYFSDGTAAGTTVLDLRAGAPGTNPGSPALLGNEVLFAASIGTDRELWKSDGVSGTATQLSDLPGAGNTFPQNLVTVGNFVVFQGTAPGFGAELWVSDGTPAGTMQLMDINPGISGSQIANLVSTGSRAVFAAYTPATGAELWSTDGTAAGTFLIEINPGSTGSSPTELVVVGNRVFFAASTTALGRELWVTDGTVAGTSVVDLGPGASNPVGLTASGNRLFFRGTLPPLPAAILVTDGTAAGTSVAFAYSGPSTLALPFGAAGGAFVIYDDESGVGPELWFTNGNSNQRVVFDIAPGQAGAPIPDEMVAINGGSQLLFLANDLRHGIQLWTSDGTAAGTQRATRFNSGGVGLVSVGEMFATGNRVFLSADDGIQGREPWVLESGPGAAFAIAYNIGCAPRFTTPPAVGASGGLPVINNSSFRVDVTSTRANNFAVLMLGFSPANANLGFGCRRLIGFPIETYGAVLTNGLGTGSASVPIPNDPNLIGVNAYFQFGLIVQGGAFLNLMDLSNGLQVQIGN